MTATIRAGRNALSLFIERFAENVRRHRESRAVEAIPLDVRKDIGWRV